MQRVSGGIRMKALLTPDLVNRPLFACRGAVHLRVYTLLTAFEQHFMTIVPCCSSPCCSSFYKHCLSFVVQMKLIHSKIWHANLTLFQPSFRISVL